jgi:hypothetical protein
LKVGQLDAGLSQFMRIRVKFAGGSIITIPSPNGA